MPHVTFVHGTGSQVVAEELLAQWGHALAQASLARDLQQVAVSGQMGVDDIP